MKTRIIALCSIIACLSFLTAQAQSYNDDAYYHPKYAKKEKAKIKDQPISTETISSTSSSSRDVDEYNRRGTSSINDLAVAPVDSVTISAEEYQEFQYSERIRRFHDADFTTHITEDGYLNVYLEDGAELTIYYDDNDWDDYYYYSWMSPWAYDRFYHPYWAYHRHYFTYDYHWHHHCHDWYYWGGFQPWYYDVHYGFYDPYWDYPHHHYPAYHGHHHVHHNAWGQPTYYAHAGKRPTANTQLRRSADTRSAVYNNYASSSTRRGNASSVRSTSSTSTGRGTSNRQTAVINDRASSSGRSSSSSSAVRSGSSSSGRSSYSGSGSSSSGRSSYNSGSSSSRS
ncbi:MAG: hypothetical protein J6Q71_05475, partial [Bacteroidales bacterium]|nr:hypothetical protein [Bacteroidales bacterium]